MHPVAEIHLRNDVDAIRADEIDQHADLHPVSAGERQPLERGAAAGVLARQRLHDPGQVGPGKLTSGRATRLGDATSAVQADALLGDERPVVERLDQGDVRLGEEQSRRPVT